MAIAAPFGPCTQRLPATNERRYYVVFYSTSPGFRGGWVRCCFDLLRLLLASRVRSTIKPSPSHPPPPPQQQQQQPPPKCQHTLALSSAWAQPLHPPLLLILLLSRRALSQAPRSSPPATTPLSAPPQLHLTSPRAISPGFRLLRCRLPSCRAQLSSWRSWLRSRGVFLRLCRWCLGLSRAAMCVGLGRLVLSLGGALRGRGELDNL